MPRGPRLDYPGALHHLIVRGIERGTIFRSERDRYHFLDRLATLIAKTGTALYAFALMPNHAHRCTPADFIGRLNQPLVQPLAWAAR